jgi:hypothetical protein
MSVTIELSNPANLIRVKSLTGAKTNEDAVELVLEEYLKDHQQPEKKLPKGDLPDEYWEDLFSESMLPNNAGSQAVIDERNEARY